MAYFVRKEVKIMVVPEGLREALIKEFVLIQDVNALREYEDSSIHFFKELGQKTEKLWLIRCGE